VTPSASSATISRYGDLRYGTFDSNGALDLLDDLAELPTGQRREVLERMLLLVRNEPEQLERTVFPD
jgi:hypothetical protein